MGRISVVHLEGARANGEYVLGGFPLSVKQIQIDPFMVLNAGGLYEQMFRAKLVDLKNETTLTDFFMGVVPAVCHFTKSLVSDLAIYFYDASGVLQTDLVGTTIKIEEWEQ